MSSETGNVAAKWILRGCFILICAAALACFATVVYAVFVKIREVGTEGLIADIDGVIEYLGYNSEYRFNGVSNVFDLVTEWSAVVFSRAAENAVEFFNQIKLAFGG